MITDRLKAVGFQIIMIRNRVLFSCCFEQVEENFKLC